MENSIINILVIEDEEAVREALERLLSKDPRFSISFAEDGNEAILLIHQFEYDIVLVDLDIPYKSGSEVIKEARDAGFKNPMIVLTGNREPDSVAKHIEHGAADYIMKPYDHDVLMAYIYRNLRKENTSIERVVRFGKYTFDTYFHMISGDGFKTFEIPEQGSKILESLVRSRLQFMEPLKLIRKAWGDESEVQERTLLRNVERLNEKFVEHGHANVIEYHSKRKLYELIRE